MDNESWRRFLFLVFFGELQNNIFDFYLKVKGMAYIDFYVKRITLKNTYCWSLHPSHFSSGAEKYYTSCL